MALRGRAIDRSTIHLARPCYIEVLQLIIAEKPSVARDLARVLGAKPSGRGRFEGNGRVITWCVGHLVELDEPAAYDPRWKAWRMDTLPMLPSEFKLRPSKHGADQLREVAALLRERRFESVVNACDAGREGELIFRYVYQYAGGKAPVLRLWISSLTDEAVRRGFAQLRPSAQLDALADAARARSEADWLVGMNATRAVTLHSRGAGGETLLSIGRVQTPTLAILVQREHAIVKFVPRDYWEVQARFMTGESGFVGRWQHGRAARLSTAPLAEAVVARAGAAEAVVEKVDAHLVHEPPPMLFDLTSLQRTANRRFGFSAQRTLEVAQALYERRKLLTYPRTDSRHLTADVAQELPKLFSALAAMPQYAPFVPQTPPRPNRRVVDDAKVHDHHAIIPTGKAVNLEQLDRDELRLFDLVVRRFLGVFHPDAEFAVTDVVVRVGAPGGALPGSLDEDALLTQLPPPPDRFVARGRVRKSAGWQAVAGIEDDESDEPLLPSLMEGQRLDGKYTSLAKKTQPPRRYTEATLLSAMESAGKNLDDAELRAAMKDSGLGTPATRAAIIETLLKRGYIVRDKKLLAPTQLGMALIDALPVQSLASPELTGNWEARLARVARGEESSARFMADIADYVREAVSLIRGAPVAAPKEAAAIGRCPLCGKPVVQRAREFGCQSCPFVLPRRIAGRAIEAPLASVLLQRRRSQVLRGFRSKKGKTFAAALVLDQDGSVRFDFGTNSPAPKSAEKTPKAPRVKPAPTELGELACPRCKSGKILTGKRGWGCSRWREGCALVIWFEHAGHKLSDSQLRDLVLRGRTRKLKWGRLVLEANGVRLE